MDKDVFIEYWNEAVRALIYDIHQLKTPITAANVNKLWQRELLDNRFFSTGIRHGAAAWLERAEKEDAQKGIALRNALNNSTLDVGVSISQAGLGVVGAAVTAGGGWTLSHLNGAAGKIGSLVAGAVGLGMMAKSGNTVYTSANVEKICEQIGEAAQKQLTEIAMML